MIQAVIAVFTVLMSFTPSAWDIETPEEREDRMMNLAVAMVMSAEKATCSGDYAAPECKRMWPGTCRELLAAEITMAKHESDLARHVQAGECGVGGRPMYECDGFRTKDGRIVFLARSGYQLHQSRWLQGEQWDRIVGLEPENVLEASWSAARALSMARHQCDDRGDWVSGMYASLATGSPTCRWSGSAERVRTFRVVLTRLSHSLVVVP